MSKFGKGKDKQTAADLGTVLKDTQQVYGLIKQAAVKGNTGKKQDRAELLEALAKTTKGVVELAVDQRKKYVAKKQDKAVEGSSDRAAASNWEPQVDNRLTKALNFQARGGSRASLRSIHIDTSTPYTIVDRRYLQDVAPYARFEKLARAVELDVDGASVEATETATFVLDVVGDMADVRFHCTAYVVECLRPSRLLFGTDMLKAYEIDLMLSRMYMRINACDGMYVPLYVGGQSSGVCLKRD